MIERLDRVLVMLTTAATLVGARVASAEIPIGVGAPLSGQMEYAGEQNQHGVELAVAELNATGGVLGQQLALYLADDYCDGEQAVAAARKLVADKVVVAIGHGCSGAAIPASDVYEAARIPFFTIATNPLLTERGLHFTFRETIRDEAQTELAADYMVRQLGARRIAVIHDTRTFGKGLAEAVSRRLAALGSPEVLFEAVQPEQTVFIDEIERLRRADIEVLYYGGYPREAALLRRQMGDAGYLPTMMAGSGIASEDYGLIAGPAADGTLVTFPRRFETAELSEFEARYHAAFGAVADRRATGGYTGTMVWAQAVAAAGTTDGPAVADTLRSRTFHALGIEVHFDEKGDAQGPLTETSIWVWHDGRQVPLGSEPGTKKDQP